MTRQTAIEILQAGLGQMINVEEIRCHGHKICRLSRLIPDGPMNYKLEFVLERNSWELLVSYIFPDVMEHYDARFDIIEQEYLYSLRDKRKARRDKQKNSRPNLLQGDLQSRIEDNGISESNCLYP